MRIKGNIELIGRVVLVELVILLLIGAVFYFQFSNAREEFINKTRSVAETIGDQAGAYFSDAGQHASTGKEVTSDDFFLFLDERLGRKKLFNVLDFSPEFFSVVFKKDVDRGSVKGYFHNDFYPDAGYSVQSKEGLISVTVPFITRGQSEPFGLVKISADNMTILKRVFLDNFLLYVAMLIVFNNQAYILYLFTRKKKEEVLVDKGYLKEHSIGALKIMHRVLGDIIDDHSDGGDRSSLKQPKEAEPVENVISISKVALRKEEKK